MNLLQIVQAPIRYSLPILGLAAGLLGPALSRADAPIDIGSRLEPLVDEFLIESMEGVQLVAHTPQRREVVMKYDQRWEGNTSIYHTILRDKGIYRMWYRTNRAAGDETAPSLPTVCYAESKDGIHWTRPELGIVELNGSTANNIVYPPTDRLIADGSINGASSFMVFLDENPACSSDERYKATAQTHIKGPDGRLIGGLAIFKSPDGIRWSVKQHRVITDGQFDARNVILWDNFRGHYVSFYRDVARGLARGYRFADGYRAISTTTSADVLKWAPKQLLDYGDAPLTELYDPTIVAYHRAPHLFVGFPLRYLVGRPAPSGTHTWPEVSDILLMTSRDGLNFKQWPEAVIRPGPETPDPEHYRWGGHCNGMVAGGIVETASDTPGAPNELSIYSIEGYYVGKMSQLRRHTYRLDGFVSVRAPATGGEFVTRPLKFSGNRLTMNFSTSAAGTIRVEIQDTSGKPLEGFGLDDCPEIYGDRVDRVVKWKEKTDVASLAAKPVRLRFVMNDADLYAIRFSP